MRRASGVCCIDEQAEQFYGELQRQGLQARLGMEASGQARWFERLLRDLQFELWIGNAAEIRTKRVNSTVETASIQAACDDVSTRLAPEKEFLSVLGAFRELAWPTSANSQSSRFCK